MGRALKKPVFISNQKYAQLFPKGGGDPMCGSMVSIIIILTTKEERYLTTIIKVKK